MSADADLARRHWHLVAHRCELAEDRDFIRLDWPLGELVVFNDKGGLVAFDNICPHRGARFFLEDRGNAPALCAYHGWSFRGGRLRIPKPDNYRPCDLAGVQLNRFHTAWCGDFLFVAAAPETDLDTQLAGLAPTLAAISADIDRRHSVDSYLFEAPWRVAVENALEPDHVHMVHAETLGLLDLDPGENRFHGRNSVLSAGIQDRRTRHRLDKLRRLFAVPAADPGYRAIFLFPFGFLTSTAGYSYALQSFLPSRGGQAHFTSRLFTARLADPAHAPMMAAFFDSVAAMNRQVFAEDHAICRRVDPAFPLDGMLSFTEVKVAHFRASLLSASGAPSAASGGPPS